MVVSGFGFRVKGCTSAVVSQHRGTPIYSPPNTTKILIGTAKMVPRILGKAHVGVRVWVEGLGFRDQGWG